MKWKKYLTGILAVAVSVSMVIPGGASPATVQAAAMEESIPEAIAEESVPEADAGINAAALEMSASTDIGYVAANCQALQNCINQVGENGSIDNPVPIKITANFDVSGVITIPAGTFVKIYGNSTSTTLTNTNTNTADGAVFRVYGGLVLDYITITATGLSGVYVAEGGEFHMESDAVIQNGNVFLETTDGETVSNYGGGVTNYGTFVMGGGTIENCKNSITGVSSGCLYGGGVYNAGTFTMTGGEITGNTVDAHDGSWRCRGYGSGVANVSTGTFTMTGGKIYGNNGERGAGVYNAGDMRLDGGSIERNTGSTSMTKDKHIFLGAGIYNDSTGILSFTEGYITNNAAGKGAGVYTAGTFTMDGGVISYNEASRDAVGRGVSCGGGVYVASGKFTLNNGTITWNTAWNIASTSSNTLNSNSGYELDTYYSGYGVIGDGGGVFVANGGAVFEMTGGEISWNVAKGNQVNEDIARQGGGVYVQGGASGATVVPGRFIMTGGSITNNAAQGGGDGVYIGNYDYFVAKDASTGTTTTQPGVTYQFRGAAGFELGGTASITGNINEDVCLSDGVRIQVTAPLEDSGTIRISVGDKSEDAVLAAYSQAGYYRTSDVGLFQLGTSEMRTIEYDSVRRALVLKKQKLDDTFTVGLSFWSAVFNGKEQKPSATVTGPDGALLPQSEYTVEYQKNTDAGKAIVVVRAAADGNYSGSIQKEFTITPKNISASGSRIAVTENELTRGTYSAWYTGKEIKPSVSLIVLKDQERGVQLLRNKDYTVSFSGNTAVGTGKVIVTGIGNYTGTLTYPFTIKKQAQTQQKSISGMSISKVADQKYTGAAITPSVTIKDGSTVLKKGTDYAAAYANNKAAGTATITITGKGNYTGTAKVTFRINPKSISGASVKTIANKAYTGRAIRPEPAVKSGSTLLKKGKDYSLSYKSNTKTGKATITITGIGNYTGKRTTTFKIVPKKAALKSVTSTKKKRLTVKWKKDAQASGYQVMVATNAKFTSGKKTKTVKKNTQLTTTFTGLKQGKKYYVAVRSYKTIDGKKAYGAWSSYKTKKVK